MLSDVIKKYGGEKMVIFVLGKVQILMYVVILYVQKKIVINNEIFL